jgi:hypothetical protein
MPPAISEQFRNAHGHAPVHLSHAGRQDLSGGKKVLDNVNLSFYPDAKIGVLGVSGSERRHAHAHHGWLDTEFVGEGSR